MQTAPSRRRFFMLHEPLDRVQIPEILEIRDGHLELIQLKPIIRNTVHDKMKIQIKLNGEHYQHCRADAWWTKLTAITSRSS